MLLSDPAKGVIIQGRVVRQAGAPAYALVISNGSQVSEDIGLHGASNMASFQMMWISSPYLSVDDISTLHGMIVPLSSPPRVH